MIWSGIWILWMYCSDTKKNTLRQLLSYIIFHFRRFLSPEFRKSGLPFFKVCKFCITILSTYVKIPIFFNQAWNLRILFPNFCSSSTTFFFFSMTDVILELAKNGMIHLQKCLAQNDKFIHVQIFLLLFFVIFIFIFFFFLLFSMTTQWVKNV